MRMALGGSAMSSVSSCKIYAYTYMALLSETRLNLHERSFILNYHLYRTDSYPGRKGGTTIAVIKRVPRNHVDLPPFLQYKKQGSAYLLVVAKYYLQMFINIIYKCHMCVVCLVRVVHIWSLVYWSLLLGCAL
jgi:hypothetical protein